MKVGRLAVMLALWTLPWAAQAQQLVIYEITYDDAVRLLKPDVIDFEDLAGAAADPTLRLPGATVGGVLQGQTLRIRSGRGHDNHHVLLTRAPEQPLRLEAGPGPLRAVVAFEPALGSFALAGFGPDPRPCASNIGTGVVTILFDEPQCMVGFRTWLEGGLMSTTLRDYPEGNLNVIFWNRSGKTIGEVLRVMDHGPIAPAYTQTSGGGPEIMAVTLQNLDPGGVAFDDLIYSPMCDVLVG